MVELTKRLFNYDADGNPVFYVEIAGLSSETKPSAGIISGSKFTEVNTGKHFVFDGLSTSKTWVEELVKTAASS